MRSSTRMIMGALSLGACLYGVFYTGIALWPATDNWQSTQWLVRLERIACYLIPIVCLFLAYWRHKKQRPLPHFMRFAKADRQNLLSSENLWNTIVFLLPALPLLYYVWAQSNAAYTSHFLVDTDFTNISSALNHSARGEGLLRTGFLQSGTDGSYLGHHFAPALFLYVPFYKLAHVFPGMFSSMQPWHGQHPTHFLYAIVLWLSLAIGLLIWSQLILTAIRMRWAAFLVWIACLYQPMLWRLTMSFHFEILVLAASGATFLALLRPNNILFYLSLFIWLCIKEDIAIYLSLLGVFLIFTPEYANHPAQGWTVLGICLLYALISQIGMSHFANGAPIAWQSYWVQATQNHQATAHFNTPIHHILLAGGLLSLFHLRYAGLVLLPLGLAHALSHQPWHNGLLGHYSYPILPFLMFGWVLAARSLSQWQDRLHWRLVLPVLGVALGLLFYIAAADRLSPLGLIRGFQGRTASDGWHSPSIRENVRQRKFRDLEIEMQKIPAGACLQAVPTVTAHTPLHARVLPLRIPEKNYYADWDSTKQASNPVTPQAKSICQSYYQVDAHALANKNKPELIWTQ